MASTAIEPGPMYDQTAFREHLMVVVHDNPGAKGISIMEELESVYGQSINHGRLYPNLERLIEQGLIEKGKQDDRTNSYTLTARGERELAAHLTWMNELSGDLLD